MINTLPSHESIEYQVLPPDGLSIHQRIAQNYLDAEVTQYVLHGDIVSKASLPAAEALYHEACAAEAAAAEQHQLMCSKLAAAADAGSVEAMSKLGRTCLDKAFREDACRAASPYSAQAKVIDSADFRKSYETILRRAAENNDPWSMMKLATSKCVTVSYEEKHMLLIAAAVMQNHEAMLAIAFKSLLEDEGCAEPQIARAFLNIVGNEASSAQRMAAAAMLDEFGNGLDLDAEKIRAGLRSIGYPPAVEHLAGQYRDGLQVTCDKRLADELSALAKSLSAIVSL